MRYIFILILVLLVACGQYERVENTAVPDNNTTSLVETVPNEVPPLPATAETVAETAPPEQEIIATEQVAEPVATDTAVPAIEPIAVTYFTPAQQEGPYYTVNKPEDRDNDLVDFAGAAGMPQGQILEFDGTVYDANGLPIEGIVIEIWQTDANGVYLHPGDPDTDSRDPNFQFYGEAVTDEYGRYNFRTILPGLYEPRPRHIHVKVKLDGQELLTTQFYFANEIDLQGDDTAMLIDAQPSQDAAGNSILVGKRDIILNVEQ